MSKDTHGIVTAASVLCASAGYLPMLPAQGSMVEFSIVFRISLLVFATAILIVLCRTDLQKFVAWLLRIPRKASHLLKTLHASDAIRKKSLRRPH